MRRYIRYGISAEKETLAQEANSYHGLVIPAHLAADQSESLPSFLRRLGKPYFVDPMTFAFAIPGADLSNSSGDGLKRSYSKLVSRYRWPRQIDFISEQVTLSDFEESPIGLESSMEEFVGSVLQLQLSLSTLDVDTRRYAELALEFGRELFPSRDVVPIPEHLIAPYFFFSDYEDSAYQLTLLAARKAVELSQGRSVLSVLAASPGFLAREDFRRLADDFHFARGVVIWADSFNDQACGERELSAFRKLIRALSKGREVLNLYGGRFSILLGPEGLAGYSSGMCYGESKVQIATSGGVIPPRYYASPAMTKLTQADTLRFLKKHGDVCKCTVCQATLSEIGGKTPGWPDRFVRSLFPPKGEGRGEADVRLKRHFLLSSAQEQVLFEGMTTGRAIEEIHVRAERLRSVDPAFFNTKSSFLLKWERALQTAT